MVLIKKWSSGRDRQRGSEYHSVILIVFSIQIVRAYDLRQLSYLSIYYSARLMQASLLGSLILLAIVSVSLLSQVSYAEDVTFVVPGSKDPSLGQSFDPGLQIIEKDQAIVFVNPDAEPHHLVIKSNADGKQVFDTGELKPNGFVSYNFSDYGSYTIESTMYPHMKGNIIVTDDIATFSKTIEDQNIEVQLSRSPANPKVNQEIYFKLIFIDRNTGRNHPHIDYDVKFQNSRGEILNVTGGHTVDGAEYWNYTFSEQDAFTPIVEVTGVNFLPIGKETVEFDTVVTPEFSAVAIAVIMASILGAVTLYVRKGTRG
jgi:plastocyanin